MAELLSARILDPRCESARHSAQTDGAQTHSAQTDTGGTNDAGTLLRIPTAWHGPITFFRPGEPFTPAESARAHRLAELAEILAHRESLRAGQNPEG